MIPDLENFGENQALFRSIIEREFCIKSYKNIYIKVSIICFGDQKTNPKACLLGLAKSVTF